MRTENSVTSVTVRHHEICRVMPNSSPERRIFNLHRTIIMKTDSFSRILFLRQLHLDLYMYCFINVSIKKCSVQLLSNTLGNVLRKNDVKMTSRHHNYVKRQNRHPDAMHDCRLHPRVRRHFLAPVGITEISVGYARICYPHQGRCTRQTDSRGQLSPSRMTICYPQQGRRTRQAESQEDSSVPAEGH